MNHGLKLHPDGTLEITMPKDKKVTRVLVCEAGTQNGSLYYPDAGTAHMVIGNTSGAITQWVKCNVCGEPVDPNDNYCSNCGRRFVDE